VKGCSCCLSVAVGTFTTLSPGTDLPCFMLRASAGVTFPGDCRVFIHSDYPVICDGERALWRLQGLPKGSESALYFVFEGWWLIQSVPGGKANALGGHSIGHSKQKCTCILFRTVFRDRAISYRRVTRHVLTRVAKCIDVARGIFENVLHPLPIRLHGVVLN
jgi:hypothetical protein